MISPIREAARAGSGVVLDKPTYAKSERTCDERRWPIMKQQRWNWDAPEVQVFLREGAKTRTGARLLRN
jgi:hypothetical protein